MEPNIVILRLKESKDTPLSKFKVFSRGKKVQLGPEDVPKSEKPDGRVILEELEPEGGGKQSC